MPDLIMPAGVRELRRGPVPVDERRRFITVRPGFEVRDSGAADAAYTLTGLAAVYNSLSEDLCGFREIIAPGAFAAVLATNPDVRCLINHEDEMVLGRTAAGTLELKDTAEGLRVWCKAPRGVTYAEDLRISMQRGDVDQMSFGFCCGDDDWAVAEDGTVVRTILTVDDLFDVSVVTFPAYHATTAEMRSLLDGALKSGRLPSVEGPSGSAVPEGAGAEAASAMPEGVGGESSEHRARRLVDERRARLRRMELDRLMRDDLHPEVH